MGGKYFAMIIKVCIDVIEVFSTYLAFSIYYLAFSKKVIKQNAVV